MLSFLINIFGCCAEVIILRYFYIKLLGTATKNKVVDYSTYFVLIIYSLFLAHYIHEPTVRTLLAIAAVIVPLYLYTYNLKLKLLYAIIYLSIQVMSESLTKAVSLLPETILPFEIGYIQGVLISKTLAFLLVLVFLSILHVRDIKLPYYLTISLLLIPALSLFLIYELRDVFYYLNTTSAYVKYLFTVLLLIGSNLILFFLFEKNTELHWLKTKILVQEALLQEQVNYYEKTVTMFHENRQLAHDFKNHLAAINGYIQDNQKEQAINYIADLTDIVQSNSIIRSGCSVIDAVLTSKQNLATKQATEFNIVEIFLPTNISTVERNLALVLATALDNALESTEKISAQQNRWINVLLRHDANYIYLQIENSTANAVIIKNNTIESTKKSSAPHGFGLSAIKSSVKSCNGQVRLSFANNIFSLTAMFPYNN